MWLWSLDLEPGAPESSCIVGAVSGVPLHLQETRLCLDPILRRQYSAEPVALLGKLRVQQGKERVVRAEERSSVYQALGLSFWVGNCCFQVSLNTGVRMFESLRIA